MKKIFLTLIAIILFTACSDDNDSGITNSAYKLRLKGDRLPNGEIPKMYLDIITKDTDIVFVDSIRIDGIESHTFLLNESTYQFKLNNYSDRNQTIVKEILNSNGIPIDTQTCCAFRLN